MERNKLYTVTKASSDNVIRLGDLIWLSEDDVLHSIMYMGTCLRKNWDIPGQNDFQVEPCEKFYPMRRKTPCFSYGDIRRVHRIYASN